MVFYLRRGKPERIVRQRAEHLCQDGFDRLGWHQCALDAANRGDEPPRPHRPLPPRNFRINGSTTAVTVPDSNTDIVLAWNHRNRTDVNLARQDSTDRSLEPGCTYTLKIYNDTNALIRTVSDLAAETYTYTAADQLADNATVNPLVLTFVLYSKMNGLFSRVAWNRTVTRTGGVAPAPPAYSPGTETYTGSSGNGNATTIGGTPVSTTTPTNGQVLTYNSTTGQWVPTTISLTGSVGGDLSGTVSNATVIKLQGRALAATAPSDGQVIAWDNGSPPDRTPLKSI